MRRYAPLCAIPRQTALTKTLGNKLILGNTTAKLYAIFAPLCAILAFILSLVDRPGNRCPALRFPFGVFLLERKQLERLICHLLFVVLPILSNTTRFLEWEDVQHVEEKAICVDHFRLGQNGNACDYPVAGPNADHVVLFGLR